MSEREQLMEYITQDIVLFLMKDRAMEVDEAMHLFYHSGVWEILHDERTGLYSEGSLYVYDLLQNELKNGVLVQEEV